MVARAALLLASAASASASAPVFVTDCCDATCIETNRKFNFPATTDADHSFKFSTSGVMSKDVTASTWTMEMTGMGMKINLSPSSGDACGGKTDIKVEGGTFGSMSVDFSDGGKVSCPQKAGSPTSSNGVSISPSDPPGSGKFLTTTKTFDQDNNMISCQICQVGGAAPPPAPPAPAPGAKLYGCFNNQCAESAQGVPLATCQAVCHQASAAGRITNGHGDAVSCKADSSASAIAAGHDLTGKVVVITGADTGIGYETALGLATTHATVVIASYSGGAAAAANITRITGNPNVEVEPIDLSKFSSVEKFASAVLAKHPVVDFLILDAGIGCVDPTGASPLCPKLPALTGDGFERVFEVNYLGHFLLTELLLPALRKSGAGRVIAVSSQDARDSQQGGGGRCPMAQMGAGTACTNMDTVKQIAKTPASAHGDGTGSYYGITKFLMQYHMKELSVREKAAGSTVRGYAMRPGFVDTPMTRKSITPTQRMEYCLVLPAEQGRPCPMPPAAGACTTTWLTVSALPAAADTEFFFVCKPETPPAWTAGRQRQLYDQSLSWTGRPAPGPAPPAPPSAAKYGCTNNQCVADPSGVPLATCQAVCHGQ